MIDASHAATLATQRNGIQSMNKNWMKCAAIMMVLGWLAPVNATPIVTAQGVFGLDVGGTLYDINIGDSDKTMGENYGGLGLGTVADPTFEAINEALINALNTIAPIPSTTFFDGCDSSTICYLILPTIERTSGFAGALPAFAPIVGSSWYAGGVGGLDAGTNYSSQDIFTYGIVSTSVPLPGTLALLGLGLVGLGVMRRKRA